MRTLFIGGPGRSGTSFVAQRLGQHGEVCAFPGIELKLFAEKNGLLDLHHSLVEAYSPNRATVALQQFRRMIDGLIHGQFGQPGLSDLFPGEVWQRLFRTFCDALLRDGHPVPVCEHDFHLAARRLLRGLGDLATRLNAGASRPLLFVEKTPHALLSMDFLQRLAPEAHFLHVMRDPRSIAYSLRKMRWGPDRLETCCAWVESYCRAWCDVERTTEGGRCLTQVRIEEISTDPLHWSNLICTRLGLRVQPNLFDGAEARVLNGWATGCDPADRALLDARLAGLAGQFGYREAAIGEITASPSPSGASMVPALAGQ